MRMRVTASERCWLAKSELVFPRHSNLWTGDGEGAVATARTVEHGRAGAGARLTSAVSVAPSCRALLACSYPQGSKLNSAAIRRARHSMRFCCIYRITATDLSFLVS